MTTKTTPRGPDALANRWMAWLLRSPLHGLLDGGTMLITVTGRRTGAAYTAPVNYVPHGGALIVLSRADRTWWRNARGAAVTLLLRGRERRGYAETIEDPREVDAAIHSLIAESPDFRRRFRVRLAPDGRPERPDRVAWLIENRVIVRISGLSGD